jgi:hypothetical protein
VPTTIMPAEIKNQPALINADARYRDAALWICESSATRQRREIALASPVFDAELMQIATQIAGALAEVSTQKVVLVNLEERLSGGAEKTSRTLSDLLADLSARRERFLAPLTTCTAFNLASSTNLKLASEQLLESFDFVVWVTPPLLEGFQGVVAARSAGQVCLALRTCFSTTSQLKRVHELAAEEHFEISISVLRETRRFLPRWIDRLLAAK